MQGIMQTRLRRVYMPWQMRLHEEANVFTRGGERVYTSRGTRLREEANAFALYLASERYCTMVRPQNGVYYSSVYTRVGSYKWHIYMKT